jgi:hypothetical protein
MVRREGEERLMLAGADPRCAFPTGGSPVPVGAGAPGSRPPSSGRDSDDEAGRRKPPRREQACGPQHQVNPAASTDEQSGGRAAHVTAKAIPTTQAPERGAGSGGVWGAARVQGDERNTGDPSVRPWKGRGDSYKPKAKSGAAQRESEGLVVPVMVATNNATGGKGPCFGRARSEGKRKGMAAKSGPNYPGARLRHVHVRQLQRGLWAGAKRPRVAHAPLGRPSVSRVPEIGTHGLKGGSALSPMRNSNV